MKLNKLNIVYFFIALHLLFAFGTYFSFIISNFIVGYGVLIVALWGAAILYLKKGNKKNNFSTIFFILVIIVLLSRPNDAGFISTTNIINSILILFLLPLSDYHLKKIYSVFVYMFFISVIPSIFVLFLYVFDIQSILPSYKIFTGDRYFIVYPGTWIQPIQLQVFSTLHFYRISGIQGEPGGVGLIAFLIILIENLDFKKKIVRIALFIGLLSASLAFYILIFIFYLFKLLESQKVSSFFKTLFLGVFFTFLLLQIPVFQKIIVDRINQTDIENEQIGNYRRTHASFSEFFTSFSNQDLGYIVFGHGVGSNYLNNAPTYSKGMNYMVFLYNYGLLTAVLVIYIFFIILNKPDFTLKGGVIILLLLIMAYQRPYLFNTGVVFLLLIANYKIRKDKIMIIS